MKLFFVLPVYNEEQNVEKMCKHLSGLAASLNLPFHIVAVNDASTDKSKSLLQSMCSHSPVIVLSHDVNQGPGAAFRTGFEFVLREGDASDVIITMDADNTHSYKTVNMILARLDEGYEVAIASVFAPGGMMIGVPFLRMLLTLACNFIYRVCFHVKSIKEYTGFYRGYRVGTLQNAKQALGGSLFHANGFASMAELLVRLRTVPVFMCEVPMIVRYDQKGGKSKLRIIKTIFEHLGVIGSNLFKRRIV